MMNVTRGDDKRRKVEQPPEVSGEDDKILREVWDEMRRCREERERRERRDESSNNRG